ncbi:MAG: hypothetical protein HMLKMBBP_03999 [Planctomycetes bacterium]|nr:hypothetical protein [Planctomycetota bacterium]
MREMEAWMTWIGVAVGILAVGSTLFYAWIVLRCLTILERLTLSVGEALEAYADAKRKG